MALGRFIISLQVNDYLSIAITTAVAYDHILTFTKEIEYIWSKPWTRVSTLFVLVRYFGLCNAISTTVLAICSSGSYEIKSHFEGVTSFYVSIWTFWFFMCVADLVMILRAWALYNRSKLIIGTLLTLYVAEATLYCLVFVIFTGEAAFNTQVNSLALFRSQTPVSWNELLYSVQIVLAALMCFLTVVRFVTDALQMYRVTKRFRFNRYIAHLAKEGMIYFFAFLVFALVNVLGDAGIISGIGWSVIVTSVVKPIPPVVLVSRFILSLRELYARDLRGGRRSEKSDIDMAFGFGSDCGYGAVSSAIVFAEAGQGEEQGEDIRMGEMVEEVRCASSITVVETGM